MSFNPEQTLKAALEQSGYQNVFRGEQKQPSEHIPAEAIFVMVFGGEQPDFTMNEGASYNRTSIQIMVRSSPQDEEGSKDRAFDIYHDMKFTAPGDSVLLRPDAPPIRLGKDDDDIYRWSINFRMDWMA